MKTAIHYTYEKGGFSVILYCTQSWIAETQNYLIATIHPNQADWRNCIYQAQQRQSANRVVTLALLHP